jgi:hypothetical protein
MVLTGESGEAVPDHIADLTAQLTAIIRAGVETGTLTATDPEATARAVFHATGRFHDPCYAKEWEQPGTEAEFEAVVELVARGLRAAIPERP